jgi:hypothetical protein
MPRKVTGTKRTTKKRAVARGKAELSARQMAWLRAAGRVAGAVERLPNIDATSFAVILRTLKAAQAEGQTVQQVKRAYYIDLRGARGVARVEATLKGG